jgi:hypothetical protein
MNIEPIRTVFPKDVYIPLRKKMNNHKEPQTMDCY